MKIFLVSAQVKTAKYNLPGGYSSEVSLAENEAEAVGKFVLGIQKEGRIIDGSVKFDDITDTIEKALKEQQLDKPVES